MTIPVSRRFVLACWFLIFSGTIAIADKPHPSIAYMNEVGKGLIEAQRNGSLPAFVSAIQRYADVPTIANFALGNYDTKLARSQRPRYYRGVAIFMGRYFAEQSADYRVQNFEIGEPTVDATKEIVLPSKIQMKSGSTYSVTWRLAWRRGQYRVIDAKVMGFSMVSMQRSLFQTFLEKRKGDVTALVTALNR